MREETSISYIVEGMTCSHCVASVSDEVGALGGVSDVSVDPAGGRLEVAGNSVSDAEVRGAVEKAGYRVVARA